MSQIHFEMRTYFVIDRPTAEITDNCRHKGLYHEAGLKPTEQDY